MMKNLITIVFSTYLTVILLKYSNTTFKNILSTDFQFVNY